MNFGELKAYLRSNLQDEVSGTLWSEDEVKAYINEAQYEAAVRSRLIFDKKSAICSFQTVAEDSDYEISPLFFRLKRLTVNGKVLCPITKKDIDSQYRHPPSSRKPHSYYRDEDGFLVLFPTPDAVYDIAMEGYRYPNELVEDDDIPEIPEKYHRKMMSWAFKLAKEKEDPETERPGDAARHEAAFERDFGPKISVGAIRKQGMYSDHLTKYSWI